MKKNKALKVLTIISLVILVICLVSNAICFIDLLKILKAQGDPNIDSGESLGNGIGMVLILFFQMILATPYLLCLVLVIVSFCKKYFTPLSITNAILSLISVILTVTTFLIV